MQSARLIDRHYRRFVEGVDPWAINKVWEQMYRAQLPTGQGFLTHNAMAGVDARATIRRVDLRTAYDNHWERQ